MSDMKYIASISYGKDSIAMLEIIHQCNLPLDRIVHVEVMATEDIPADLPEVHEWKEYADKIIYKRYGIKVEHMRADKTYKELFYSIPKRSAQNKHLEGKIQGFPSLRGQWCSRDLKVNVMKTLGNSVQYIGIAIDEPERHNQLNEKLRSPLVDFNITEAECIDICKGLGLLAPTYLQSKRNGCWFCHAQPIKQLRLLRKQYPSLWNMLLEFDSDSPMPFRHGNRHGTHSVHDFDERFMLEDKGILEPECKKFRWAKMDEYRKQLITRK